MNIPFFNYKALFTENEKAFTDVFTDIGRRGAYIMQDDLIDFELKIAKYSGAKFALGVANATDAMQLLLKAGGIKAGDEVIFCSHTMIATASAIAFTGAIPVPVDAGNDHLIDPNSIRQAITKKTKAIIPTQLNGRVADMDKILIIAKEFNLQVYEDSAQALGAKFKGQAAGTFGLGGCISFYPAKTLGCFGDGGAILTNDRDVYDKVKLMRDHGRGIDGNITMWGFNSRLDNLQAAILNLFFENYNKTVDRRREIAYLYHENLKALTNIVLPPKPSKNSIHFDIFQNYEIEADRRDDLKKYLSDQGVGTLIQWGGKAVHEFRDLGFSQSLPFTENIMKRSLMLPLNMTVSDEEVNFISNCVLGFYNDRY
jgi:dTDP-4-amino-4,6-dideoxygalactose transaminase